MTALHPSRPVPRTVAAPFALHAHTGQTVSLPQPAVLVFYRGHW